ncbi:PadR family transcriptional regulator [Allosphingosinicella vermicomposti]|uniref:PadR family transcriptional regulator n=1 Tax=Allosphingosinicella vermicomposti TaxID=614671 RepID=UPI001FE00E08|nr:PadR family transcriptional regulator [Allosphingosinicella vermicomposti]
MRFGQSMGTWAFGGWGEGHRGEGRGRRHGGRRMFDGGELRLVLLKLISEQSRHGYDLIRAIEEMTGGHYAPSPGVIYPTLTMLQDMGHIEEAPAEGSRKLFRVTDDGLKYLAAKADEVDALTERLNAVGARQRRHGATPVGRAMTNLGAVISHRLHQEDMPHQMLHDMAEIIDEAARRIERL